MQAKFLPSICFAATLLVGCGGNGKTKYSLSLDTQGVATVTLDPPGGTYDPDTWVYVTVTPGLSREFVQILWEDGSAICDHPVQVKMDEDKSGTVVCTSAGTYALRVYTGNLAPVWFDPPGGVYAPGTVVTITYSCPPDHGTAGLQWEDGTWVYDHPLQVTMDADKTGDVEYQQLGWPGPE